MTTTTPSAPPRGGIRNGAGAAGALLTACACLALGGIAAAPATAAPPLFDAPWRAFPAGEWPNIGPTAVATGDLDGDGDEDAVLGLFYFGAPGIAVLAGNGDGTYADPVVYETGINRSVADVALVDVDGDGDLDVLATISDSPSGTERLAYWRNDGSGSLGTRREFPTGEVPWGLAVADFTGDGFPDAALAGYGAFQRGSTLVLMPHNGQSGAQAGFLAPRSFQAGDGPEDIAAGDLDGDGDADVVLGSFDGHVVMFNEDGAGSFGPPDLYPIGDGGFFTYTVALADLDVDGDLDLLGSADGVIEYRLNDGNGNFGPQSRLRLENFAFLLSAIVTGELNGDGFPDIVGAAPTGRALDGYHVFLSDGSGGFDYDGFHEAAKETDDIALADADGDGDLDVLTAAFDSAVLTVHRNPGDGRLPILPRYGLGVLTTGMDGADLDGDGDVDIATADDDVRVLLNDGDGTFAPAVPYGVPFQPEQVKLRDMNGDGAPDLLTSSSFSSDFAVAINNGDGSFQPFVATLVGGNQRGDVDAFDLDGDGDLDVAVTDEGPGQRINLARNLGSGTAFVVVPPLEVSSLPFGIGGGDFDNDGNVDLVTSNATGLTLYPGNGDFTFRAPLPTGELSLGFTVADVDLDGELDLAYRAGQLTGSTEWVAVMRGFGDGSFAFPVEMPGPVGLEAAFQIAADIDVADVSGDGLPDVVLTGNAPGDIAVFRGNGDGTLQPQERYGVGYQAFHSVLADLDGDAVTDVASVISLPPSGLSDAMVVLAGRGAGEPGSLRLELTGACPGTQAVRASGATPGQATLFLRGVATGAVVIPPGAPCAGTQLGLGAPGIRVLRRVAADGDGVAGFTLDTPPGACGVVLLQAIDLASCATSNLAAF